MTAVEPGCAKYVEIMKVPLHPGTCTKVSEYMLNDPNGLEYTQAQTGNISATSNLYATEEGVETIVFVSEWESKEEFEAYSVSEGRTNESWKEIAKSFVLPTKFVGMEPMGGVTHTPAPGGKAIGFVVLVEMAMLPNSAAKVSQYMLHDPNGLEYTKAQQGNISATSNLYTTEEGVDTIVFFNKWESRDAFIAYNDSEGRRSNESWKELATHFVGIPTITLMRPLGSFADEITPRET